MLTGHHATDAADHTSDHIGIWLALSRQLISHQLHLNWVQLQFWRGTCSRHNYLQNPHTLNFSRTVNTAMPRSIHHWQPSLAVSIVTKAWLCHPSTCQSITWKLVCSSDPSVVRTLQCPLKFTAVGLVNECHYKNPWIEACGQVLWTEKSRFSVQQRVQFFNCESKTVWLVAAASHFLAGSGSSVGLWLAGWSADLTALSEQLSDIVPVALYLG